MKIHTIGGYEKVGGNMTGIEVGGELVLLDIGADIERIVEQEKNIEDLKTVEAIESKIVPDDSRIKKKHRDDVAAIIVGHGHQDHSRGLPKLAGAYDCPIIATPYTSDIIERFIENDREHVKNETIRLEPDSTFHISKEFELEFVHITHSIPQSVLTVLRTDEGTVIYSLDFKLDENPTLGKPVDYEKLEKLGEEDIKAYIVDCTRIDQLGRANSEKKTKKELEKLFSKHHEDGRGVIVTTFSSHIARLNNIMWANKGRRKIVMLGRSLKEYTKDAEKQGLIDLSDVEVASYREEVETLLRRIAKNKSSYILVTTGNQGEPNAILSRIAEDEYPYSVNEEDVIIFSSVTIPTPINEMNREYLKRTLRQRGANIEVDVHSHGHAMREDHRDLMKILQPEHVIPAHGGKEKLSSCARLAREEGIDSVRVAQNNGIIISLN